MAAVSEKKQLIVAAVSGFNAAALVLYIEINSNY